MTLQVLGKVLPMNYLLINKALELLLLHLLPIVHTVYNLYHRSTKMTTPQASDAGHTPFRPINILTILLRTKNKNTKHEVDP